MRIPLQTIGIGRVMILDRDVDAICAGFLRVVLRGRICGGRQHLLRAVAHRLLGCKVFNHRSAFAERQLVAKRAI